MCVRAHNLLRPPPMKKILDPPLPEANKNICYYMYKKTVYILVEARLVKSIMTLHYCLYKSFMNLSTCDLINH